MKLVTLLSCEHTKDVNYRSCNVDGENGVKVFEETLTTFQLHIKLYCTKMIISRRTHIHDMEYSI